LPSYFLYFLFTDPAPTYISPLSLHDALPIFDEALDDVRAMLPPGVRVDVVYERTDLVDRVLRTVERNLLEGAVLVVAVLFAFLRSEEHTSELQSLAYLVCRLLLEKKKIKTRF